MDTENDADVSDKSVDVVESNDVDLGEPSDKEIPTPEEILAEKSGGLEEEMAVLSTNNSAASPTQPQTVGEADAAEHEAVVTG